MLRRALAGMLALLIIASAAAAGDKEIKCKVVKVDVKKMQLTVQTEDGKKTYTISDKTKFLGPKKGVSAARLEDDRLIKGAEIILVIAANNRTVHEVRLPERKKKDKNK
jgi:hypothetical protein